MFARGTFEQHTSRKENKLPKIVYVALVRGGANGQLICPDVRMSSVCVYMEALENHLLERNKYTVFLDCFIYVYSLYAFV